MAKKEPDIPRITKVYAHNFRSLRDIEVELSPLTVLVGPNASGKSNFVDVLRFVAEALPTGLDNAITTRHGVAALRRWSAKGRPYDIEVGLKVKGDESRYGGLSGEYSFVVGSEPYGQYRVKHEYVRLDFERLEARPLEFETKNGQVIKVAPEAQPLSAHGSGLEATTLALSGPTMRFAIARTNPRRGRFPPVYSLFPLYNLLTRMRFYHIFPNVIREPQKPGIPYPLTEHGENLASVLREMFRQKSPFLPSLRETLGKVVPGICDLQVTGVGGYLVVKLKHLTGVGDGQGAWFDLSQESDGTVRLLGLLVALFQDPPPTLIAIEEPELTIHPGALAVLADLLQEASRRTQVLVTTHSPDLIDRVPVESLRVVESVGGSTVIAPVAEHQREAVRRGLFSPGELHRMEGLQTAGVRK